MLNCSVVLKGAAKLNTSSQSVPQPHYIWFTHSHMYIYAQCVSIKSKTARLPTRDQVLINNGPQDLKCEGHVSTNQPITTHTCMSIVLLIPTK